MMMFRKLSRALLFVALALTGPANLGCSEDCEEEHQLCLAEITTALNKFSYEVTCRYPSMNSGDARRYCECDDGRCAYR